MDKFPKWFPDTFHTMKDFIYSTVRKNLIIYIFIFCNYFL